MYKIITILTVILFSPIAHAQNNLRLMTEEFAPYQFYDGEDQKLTGISIEIVQAIQNELGDQSELKVLPWSRGLKLLNKHPNSALFSTARTPEREDKYKWVGPLSELEMVFFRKKGSGIHFTSMEEAKTVGKIGVTKNVATQEILQGMGFQNLDLMLSGSDDKNLKRLLKGRIDVWPTAYYAGIYSAKQIGALDEIEIVPDVTILSGFLYIAFNKDTQDEIIHKWQLAIDKLKKDGIIDDIHKKYDR